MTTAQIEKLARDEHLARIRAHDLQPVDAGWAKGAETSLRAGLEERAKGASFHVVALECRTTSCSALLEWPTMSDAAKDYEKILRGEYPLNCGVAVALIEEPQEGKPYRTSVIYDCTAAKFGES
jgi:hypothetical protein